MNLDRLRVNQLSSDGFAWYRSYLTALDRFDIDAYSEFLADDVTAQFNNDAPMVGKPVVTGGLGGYWQSLSGMGYSLLHEPLNIYGDDRHFVLEALNHYDSGDRRVTVRAVAFTDRDPDGMVTSIRLYQDVSQVFAAASTTSRGH